MKIVSEHRNSDGKQLEKTRKLSENHDSQKFPKAHFIQTLQDCD